MASETYLSVFEDGDHPEVVDNLATDILESFVIKQRDRKATILRG